MSNKDETKSRTKSDIEDRMEISILFKFIKPYDGSRDKLNSFITNCNNAYSLASASQKPILFKYILSQLECKAESATSIKDFETWEQLSEFLKTQFGERKHYAHLLADLQECRQSVNEPVNQYALRVETCLSKLLTEVTLSCKKKTELIGRLAAMDDLALHTFLLGLTPRISNLVRVKEPSSLNEAINEAASEEKILALQFKRNQPSTNSQNSIPHRVNRKSENYYRSNIQNSDPRFTKTIFGPKNDFGVLFCRYCKTQGHTIDICRKREFNNRRFNVSQVPSASRQRPFPTQVPQQFQKQQTTRVNLVNENEIYPDDTNIQTQYSNDDHMQYPEDQALDDNLNV